MWYQKDEEVEQDRDEELQQYFNDIDQFQAPQEGEDIPMTQAPPTTQKRRTRGEGSSKDAQSYD